MIKSFLNYPGGKYKLLNQIEPLFPKNCKRFVDLFTGSAVVAINSKYPDVRVEAYDNNEQLINLLKFVQKVSVDEMISRVFNTIEKYGLSDTNRYGYSHYNVDSSRGLGNFNKDMYMKVRKEYNRKVSLNIFDPVLLYVLIVFGFNNQIRFNRRNEFNNPVGKRDFNKNMQKKLVSFCNEIKRLNIEFECSDFRLVDFSKLDSFFYVDPPYLITTAVYNENSGWTLDDERDLLSMLEEINKVGNKFALSNVLMNKGHTNDLLIEWSKDYNVHHLNKNYFNSNYHDSNKKNVTDEVLITNY
ncbi:IS1595 family transposase ISCco4 [Companilactobacillus paralimentarius]|uniref:DNA adenine methylase n=1 Tax=Companilactobacillus paralimentarius TaxID=83526 RepID=UPI00384AEA93